MFSQELILPASVSSRLFSINWAGSEDVYISAELADGFFFRRETGFSWLQSSVCFSIDVMQLWTMSCTRSPRVVTPLAKSSQHKNS